MSINYLLDDLKNRVKSNPNMIEVSSDDKRCLILLLQNFTDWTIFNLVTICDRTIVRNLEDVLAHFPRRFQKLFAEIVALNPPFDLEDPQKSKLCDHKQVANNLLRLKSEEAWFIDLQKLKASQEKLHAPSNSDHISDHISDHDSDNDSDNDSD
jgi:hypothetical protein